MHGCFLLFFAMFCILIIGVMSVLQAAQAPQHSQVTDASRFFSPTQNPLGFTWLLSSILMLVAVPIYVVTTYRSALVFRFSKRENAFYRGRGRVCQLTRIENLTLQEDKDPDLRYLYLLGIVYNDGQRMLLYNGYDERETMNLANELSSFLEVKVTWLSAPDRK